MLSYVENIPTVLKAVADVKPKMVLDCGPGFGKYGLLIREQYLSEKAAAGELSPIDDLVIDACELTPYFTRGYNGARLTAIYDATFKADMLDMSIHRLNNYNLILLIDVVEHYPKDVIKRWLRGTARPTLISTPKEVTMYDQHYYGDPHVHQSQWDASDFTECSEFKDYSTPLSHVYLVQAV